MVRALMIAAFWLGLGPGCDQVADSPERLVPPGDQDYPDLEQPEVAGECQSTTECEHSCLHQCAPIPDGPITCPADPLPLPARLEGAACRCNGDFLCAWYSVEQD